MKNSRVCIVSTEYNKDQCQESSRYLLDLAIFSASSNNPTTILVVNEKQTSNSNFVQWVRYYAQRGIEIIALPQATFSFEEAAPRNLSFEIYQWLKTKDYSQIYFPDKDGVAYYSLLSKKQKLHFSSTDLNLICFEPFSWKTNNQGVLFNTTREIELDFLEKKSIDLADTIFTPVALLAEWLNMNGWKSLDKIKIANCYQDLNKTTVSSYKPVLEEPFISICIAHYERPKLLEQTLESLSDQTYINFEIVIVDDGSTKIETLEYLKKIEMTLLPKLNGRIVYSESGGPSYARNVAAHNSRGKYLLFMDDDNYAKPHELQTFATAIQNTDADILTCGFDKIYLQSKPSELSQAVSTWIPLGGSATLGLLSNIYGDMNCLVRKEVYIELNGLSGTKESIEEDWEFFSRATLSGYKIEVIPESLYWYRDHQQSHSKKIESRKNLYSRIKPYLERLPADLRPTISLLVQSEKKYEPPDLSLNSEANFFVLIKDFSFDDKNIHPINDTEKLYLERDSLVMISKGRDPGIVFQKIEFFETQNIILELEISVIKNTYIQLFYLEDGETDFSEKNSVRESLSPGRSTAYLKISSPCFSGNYRVDIGDEPAKYQIHTIKFYGSYSLHKLKQIKQISFNHNLNSFRLPLTKNEIQKQKNISKILSHLYYNTLYNLAHFLDNSNFTFFNRFVSLVYRRCVTPIIEKLAQWKLRNGDISLISRHSSVYNSRFNFLLSDLDWDVSLPEKKQALAPLISKWVLQLKIFFPFLGELEYYFASELEAKARLTKAAQPYYSQLRSVRKIFWLIRDVENAESVYHKYKALRALQICYDSLKISYSKQSLNPYLNISPWLEKVLLEEFSFVQLPDELLTPIENRVIYSNYLGCQIFLAYYSYEQKGLKLSPWAGLVLLSIIPGNRYESHEVKHAVDYIRSHYVATNELHKNLTELEILITQAAARGYDAPPDWALSAFSYLKDSQSKSSNLIF